MAKVYDLGFTRGSETKLLRDLKQTGKEKALEADQSAALAKPATKGAESKDSFVSGKTEAEKSQESFAALSKKASAVERKPARYRELDLAHAFGDTAFDLGINHDGLEQAGEIWAKISPEDEGFVA